MYINIQNARAINLDDLLQVEQEAWGDSGENIGASTNKIRGRIQSFPTGVSIAYSATGAVAGSQYAFCFNWNGNLDVLSSWDRLTANGDTKKMHVTTGNTGFLVGVGVIPHYRGVYFAHNLRWEPKLKVSELLIGYTLDNLFASGVTQIVGNARIPGYHTKPELSVDDYCTLRRDDGLLYDPVLRFHERMGAQVIKPVSYSMEDPESRNGGCWVQYSQQFAA